MLHSIGNSLKNQIMNYNLFRILLLIFFQSITLSVIAQGGSESLYLLYARNGMLAQSGDCYDNYLVLVTRYEAKIGLYNLKSKRLCCVCKREPKMEMVGKSDVYHANNSSFGTQRYAESDPFPLLYVSNRVNNNKRGVLDVFRLVPLKSEGAKDYDSLVVQQVQTIYYPTATDKNALGSPWTVIDRENNYMYTYSRNNRGKASNYGVCRISKFRIPSVKSSHVVYLNDEDILDSYEVGFNAPLAQGACIHKGKMYISQGVSPKYFIGVRVVDLKEHKLIKNYDLRESGFMKEPEGCFIYNDQLMIATSGKKIYKIKIPINE